MSFVCAVGTIHPDARHEMIKSSDPKASNASIRWKAMKYWYMKGICLSSEMAVN